MGGCDGARPGRNYYTDFVKQTPPDTLILTLACGKFRFDVLFVSLCHGADLLVIRVGQLSQKEGVKSRQKNEN